MLIIRKLIAAFLSTELCTLAIYNLFKHDKLFHWKTNSLIDLNETIFVRFLILYFPISLLISQLTKRLGEDRKPVAYIYHALAGILISVITHKFMITGAFTMLSLAYVDEYLSSKFPQLNPDKADVIDRL